jgi:hypothetical protein
MFTSAKIYNYFELFLISFHVVSVFVIDVGSMTLPPGVDHKAIVTSACMMKVCETCAPAIIDVMAIQEEDGLPLTASRIGVGGIRPNPAGIGLRRLPNLSTAGPLNGGCSLLVMQVTQDAKRKDVLIQICLTCPRRETVHS